MFEFLVSFLLACLICLVFTGLWVLPFTQPALLLTLIGLVPVGVVALVIHKELFCG